MLWLTQNLTSGPDATNWLFIRRLDVESVAFNPSILVE